MLLIPFAISACLFLQITNSRNQSSLLALPSATTTTWTCIFSTSLKKGISSCCTKIFFLFKLIYVPFSLMPTMFPLHIHQTIQATSPLMNDLLLVPKLYTHTDCSAVDELSIFLHIFSLLPFRGTLFPNSLFDYT